MENHLFDIYQPRPSFGTAKMCSNQNFSYKIMITKKFCKANDPSYVKVPEGSMRFRTWAKNRWKPQAVHVERASFIEGWYCCKTLQNHTLTLRLHPSWDSLAEASFGILLGSCVGSKLASSSPGYCRWKKSTSDTCNIHIHLILEPPETDREPASTSFVGHIWTSFQGTSFSEALKRRHC